MSGNLDALEFLNGDLLMGKFLGGDSKEGFRWRHPAITQTLTINSSGLSRIRLWPPAESSYRSGAKAYDCVVTLQNGDELTGKLGPFTEDHLTLNTWYGGTLNIARTSVKTLQVFASRNPIVYEGPNGPEGWVFKGGTVAIFGNVANLGGFGGQIIVNGGVVVANGQIIAEGGKKGSGWQFRDDGLYGMGGGTVARDVKLPQVSNLEFDLTYRTGPQMCVYFYSDFLEGYSGNAYVLQISMRNIFLRRQSQKGAGHNLGNAEYAGFPSRGRVRISIRSNLEQKTIALLVDGVLVKQWTDTGEFAGNGTGVIFMVQGQSPIKISNIRVSEWDGVVEEAPTSGVEAREDMVRLANRDTVSGVFKGIKDGKALLATSFAELEVPLDRIQNINFKKSPDPNEATGTNLVRLYFADRGRLTLNLESWNDHELAGVCPAMGAVRLSPQAFAAVAFNVDKPRVNVYATEPGGVANPFFDLKLD